MDLRDLEHNTRDGVHVASLAGSWLALVCGFGGMRDHDGALSFAPRLPAAITALSFAVGWRGATVRVRVDGARVRYSIENAPAGGLALTHHGHPFVLDASAPIELDVPELKPLTARPTQPAGRAPESPNSPVQVEADQ
jgi:alpha,alpha-trehalose phosphorylase